MGKIRARALGFAILSGVEKAGTFQRVGNNERRYPISSTSGLARNRTAGVSPALMEYTRFFSLLAESQKPDALVIFPFTV